MIELVYFVTSDGGSHSVGPFGMDNREFCGLKDENGALQEARETWRKNFGKVRQFIHRIDVETCGKTVDQVEEWKPSEDDYVWLAETMLGRWRAPPGRSP